MRGLASLKSRTGIRDQKSCLKTSKVFRSQTWDSSKEGFSSISFFFFFNKVFHSVCHWLSGYLGFNPRKQRHVDFSKFLPDFL